jgi:hypothetical protein
VTGVLVSQVDFGAMIKHVNGITREWLQNSSSPIMRWLPLLFLAGLLLPVVLLFVPMLFCLLTRESFCYPPPQPEKLFPDIFVSGFRLRGPPQTG